MAVADNFFNKKAYSKSSSVLEESKDSVVESNLINQKENIRKRMGTDVFNYYYDFLYEKRLDPRTDEAKLRKELNGMIGSSKELKNLIFEMEQVIFKEMQAQLNN